MKLIVYANTIFISKFDLMWSIILLDDETCETMKLVNRSCVFHIYHVYKSITI